MSCIRDSIRNKWKTMQKGPKIIPLFREMRGMSACSSLVYLNSQLVIFCV